MNLASRKCPKCGWEFPSCYTNTKCKFCHTVLETQWCLSCKAWVPTEHFYEYKSGKNKGCLTRVCKSCTAKQKYAYNEAYPERVLETARRYIQGRRAAAAAKYEEWMDLTKVEFKTMTESDWLKACRYFGGCAICGSEHIEARQFLVPFKEGGRYSAWNMFPMCSKCMSHARTVSNPFVWLDKFIGSAVRYGLTDERRDRLLEYFIMKIQEVTANDDA